VAWCAPDFILCVHTKKKNRSFRVSSPMHFERRNSLFECCNIVLRIFYLSKYQNTNNFRTQSRAGPRSPWSVADTKCHLSSQLYRNSSVQKIVQSFSSMVTSQQTAEQASTYVFSLRRWYFAMDLPLAITKVHIIVSFVPLA
jgi:hypothetical protein